MTTLQYPNDRVGGYVQLTDANGEFYVPEFTSAGEPSNPLRYCQAFVELMRRMGVNYWRCLNGD